MIMSNLFRPAWWLVAGITLIMVTAVAAAAVQEQEKRGGQKPRPRARPAVIPPAGEGWYTFRGPDKDFTIRFPGKPAREEGVQGPVTLLRRYAAAANGIYFELSIQDIGGVPGTPEASEFGPGFERNMAERLTKEGFRIVHLRRTAKNNYEMEAWTPREEGPGFLHSLERGVIHNGRIYSMGCNSLLPEREVDRKKCRHFLDSFRITGALR